jgi:hypothetical protein
MVVVGAEDHSRDLANNKTYRNTVADAGMASQIGGKLYHISRT